MTGEKLLKNLSLLCYILGIIGIVLSVIIIADVKAGDVLLEGYMDNYNYSVGADINPKTMAIMSILISSLFDMFEGWLLGRAAKDGRKTKFLIVLLVLGLISPLLKLFGAGFNSILNVESLSNIIAILIKVFILNQVIKLRREALEELDD